ncbi:unnamed protein product, partial [Mesorhabditis spiculigera]
MAGRKRNTEEKDEEYRMKRQKNNEAVNRTRQKKREEETNTTKRVDELRKENAELERKVESLQNELKFLKEMFVAYAAGNKRKNSEVEATNLPGPSGSRR